MIRPALRLCTVAALCEAGVGAPTMAGQYVYDSRGDDINDIAAEERRAVIVVRTGEDTEDRGATGSRAARGRTIDLRIELSLVTGVMENGQPVAAWPETDNELEAILDVFEWQVRQQLFGWRLWPLFWKDMWTVAGSLSSVPIYTSEREGSVRLAAREIRLAVGVPGDCFPKPVIEGDEMNPAGLDPLLIRVFNRIDRDGAGDFKAMAAALRERMEARPLVDGGAHPLLRRVHLDWPGGRGVSQFATDFTVEPLGPNLAWESVYVPGVYASVIDRLASPSGRALEFGGYFTWHAPPVSGGINGRFAFTWTSNSYFEVDLVGVIDWAGVWAEPGKAFIYAGGGGDIPYIDAVAPFDFVVGEAYHCAVENLGQPAFTVKFWRHGDPEPTEPTLSLQTSRPVQPGKLIFWLQGGQHLYYAGVGIDGAPAPVAVDDFPPMTHIDVAAELLEKPVKGVVVDQEMGDTAVSGGSVA